MDESLHPPPSTLNRLSVPRLCGWALGYALRRGWPFLGVSGSLLLRIALDVVKPLPLVFLLDFVLGGKPLRPGVARLVEILPGATTPAALAGWSVAATVVVFLLSWLAGL